MLKQILLLVIPALLFGSGASFTTRGVSVCSGLLTFGSGASFTSTCSSSGPQAPVEPAPTVTSVSPTSGPLAGLTTLTVTGTEFVTGATSTVGGSACTSPNVVNSTSLTCTLPAKSAGAYTVAVTNPDLQSGSLPNAYTYVAAPTVTSVSPTEGDAGGGTAITITGTGFVTLATATVGGVTCTSPSVVNSTTLTCTTGAHAAGVTSIIVTNPDTQTGTGSNLYTYTAAFSPEDVSGLTQWLDASDGAQLYTDTGCSAAVASDADAVKCWKDKTANAYNITEATNAPVYKTGIINSKHVVRFDGTNDKLTSTATASQLVSETAMTVFLVGRVIAYGTNQPDGAMFDNEPFWNDANSNFGMFLKSGDTTVNCYAYSSAAKNSKLTVATGTAVIMQLRLDSGNIIGVLNGGSEVSTAMGAGLSWTAGAVFKYGVDYGAAFANVDIGEMLVYNVAVGSSDRAAILSYLNDKWAAY